MISRSTLDQLTEILRSELDKKVQSRPNATGKKPAGGAARADSPPSLSETLRPHIAKLLAAGVTDESQLVRAAVEHILHRQFGDALVNDPSFQAVTSRVAQTVLEHGNLKAELLAAIMSG